MILCVLVRIAKSFIHKLKTKFLTHGAMDVLEIMYPPFIGYSWNVMHHLSNIFTLLILLLL